MKMPYQTVTRSYLPQSLRIGINKCSPFSPKDIQRAPTSTAEHSLREIEVKSTRTHTTYICQKIPQTLNDGYILA